MSDIKKPAVGQILYSLNIGNAARHCEQILTPVTVTKVGRKYFTCIKNGFSFGIDYHLDTWREKTGYSASSILYESEQSWIDEKDARVICKFIAQSFEYGLNKLSLSLPTLRGIERMIKANITEKEVK